MCFCHKVEWSTVTKYSDGSSNPNNENNELISSSNIMGQNPKGKNETEEKEEEEGQNGSLCQNLSKPEFSIQNRSNGPWTYGKSRARGQGVVVHVESQKKNTKNGRPVKFYKTGIDRLM
jgi:hypothetical protein